MKAFKAYDIRGEWGTDLNADIAYRIGYFLPDILDTNTYLVGRDMRLSSDTFFEALTQGLTDRGRNVHDIGLATTPLVYWSTAKYGYNASIQITASHNPKNHNGLKISAANALPVGYDTGLNKLETLVESDKTVTPCATKGKIHAKQVLPDYFNFQRQFVGDLSNLNIAVDCSNGMASLLVHKLIGEASPTMSQTRLRPKTKIKSNPWYSKKNVTSACSSTAMPTASPSLTRKVVSSPPTSSSRFWAIISSVNSIKKALFYRILEALALFKNT